MLRSNNRHRSIIAVAMLFLVIAISACSSPAQSTNAASIGSVTIPMSDYLALSRLIYITNQLQNTSLATWQTPNGRMTLAQAQQGALQTLVSNVLLTNAATTLKIDVSTVQSKALTQTQQFLAKLNPQYKPLEDQGVISLTSIQPLFYQQIIQGDVFGKITVPTAHIRMLTVQKLADAQSLEAQLQKGADWTTLASKFSVDPAQSNGGDVPIVVPGVLAASIDAFVFGNNTVFPSAIKIIPNHNVFMLVQVVSVSKVVVSSLPTNSGIFPTSSISVQASAVQNYTSQLIRSTSLSIYVDWCGGSTAQSCGPLM